MDWNNKQKGLRAVVEAVIGYVKQWDVAHHTFVGAPEVQQLALMTVYNLANHMLTQYPLRNEAAAKYIKID